MPKYETESVNRASQRLGVSRPTVYAMIARKELTARRVADRTVVVWDQKAQAIENEIKELAATILASEQKEVE